MFTFYETPFSHTFQAFCPVLRDKIDEDLTKLKISQAEIKGELETFRPEVKGEVTTIKTEVSFVRDDVKDLKNSYRTQIWALIITIIGAIIATVIKFGFFPNP